jgi:outer membrane protein OmpA-like peptidoglycan-associated protein
MPKVSMDQYEAMLELSEAQNATGIARAANAEQYAPQTFARAQQLLADAQRMQDTKGSASMVVQVAREAAQTAEDARVIAEKHRQEDRVAAAESAAARAQEAQARAEGEAQRMRTEADAARSQAGAERVARERAEADTADARRLAAQQQTALIAPPPPPATQPDNSRKTELRMRLMEQLNGVLPARDTPRGMVATVSDSSFSGGELRGPTADQLARLLTILAPYPNLRLVVEGHSDSASTQAQSARRAESVRQSLVGRGLPPDRVTVLSMGDSRPLVSNSGPAGREQNRRVEIVISGDAIGTLPFWDRTYSLTQKR